MQRLATAAQASSDEWNDSQQQQQQQQRSAWWVAGGLGLVSSSLFLLSQSLNAFAAEEKPAQPAIFTLVLTGGPCGGKTSALNRLTELLRSKGWDIYLVPEVPTIMLSGGCKYPGADKEKLFEFETALIKLQLQMEDSFIQVARSTGRPSIIIFDRGTCDVAAYLPSDLWAEILAANNWTQKQLFDRYDCVMHLVTAADGAEKFYTTANNAARSESPERARELDQRVLKAWADHPAHRVIDNSTSFDGKLQRTCDALTTALPK